MKTAACVLLAALLLPGNAWGDGAHDGAKVTPLMRQPLADQPGKEGVLITVEFAPGDVDAAHRHPGHAFIYVLEGTVVMQMEGGELRTLKPGDTFYENPKDIHRVGRNLSKTAPAKLLVFLVTERDVPLVLPASGR